METVHVYGRSRRRFGRALNLSDDDPQETKKDTIGQGPEFQFDYVNKNPCDAGSQPYTDKSTHETNTESVKTESRSMNHVEGGWPKDIGTGEMEQMIRLRKKVEKEVPYIQTVQNLCLRMDKCIRQNNAINIYEEYFPEEVEPIYAPAEIRAVNAFKDQMAPVRPISGICWNPSNRSKLAAAYSVVDFQRGTSDLKYNSYVWDITCPKAPDAVMRPPSPIVTLGYSPKDAYTIAGGLLNGQVAYWDLRTGPQPVETSDLELGHKYSVRRLVYLSAKSGTEFFTTSTDGMVMWWDIRKVNEPCSSLELCTEKFGSTKYFGTALEYCSSLPTRFMVGTEQGPIIYCNRKGKSTADKFTYLYRSHTGPIRTIQRNPFVTETFLSISGWSCRLWSEDVRDESVMLTKLDEAHLLDGCWSTTRPAVFVTAKSDGYLDVWDITRSQKAPYISKKVSGTALQCVRMDEGGQLVATGSRDGTLALMEFSSTLSTFHPGEKSLYASIMERETRREKLHEGFRREQRIREKSAQTIVTETEQEPAEEKKEPVDYVALTDETFKTDFVVNWKDLKEKRAERAKKAREMAEVISREATQQEHEDRVEIDNPRGVRHL